MQTPRIEELPAVRLVGMETAFIHCLSPDANNDQVVAGLWRTFFDRMEEIEGRGTVCWGMVRGLPAERLSHPDERLYFCGVEVPEEHPVPEGMVVRETPATTYAVFEHHGPMTEIARTVGEIYDGWLPVADHEHSGIADVERYDERFDGCTPESVMEYRISVRRTGEAAGRSG